MKVWLFPGDDGACGKLRLIWPGEAARAAGYDVSVIPHGPQQHFLPLQVGYVAETNSVNIRWIGPVPDVDVMVFARPTQWRIPFAIAELRRHGIRCVVELDDDLGAIHPEHDAYLITQPDVNPWANWDHCKRACDAADALVVTTPRLAERYGRTKATVVENHVPAWYLDAVPERDPERFVIGWAGRVGSHAGDLEATRGAMQKAMDVTGGAFRVLGLTDRVREVGQLRDEPEHAAPVPLSEYPQALGQFDVGIAPLATTGFNQAKSWLKPLDYAAAGVPFVASPSSEYRRFCAQGVGTIAAKPREWVDAIHRLWKNPSLRAEQAAAGKEVAARWLIEDHVDDFMEAWCGVVPIRQSVDGEQVTV